MTETRPADTKSELGPSVEPVLNAEEAQESESEFEAVLTEAELRIETEAQAVLGKVEDALALATKEGGGESSSYFAKQISAIKEKVLALASEARERITDYKVRAAMRSASSEGMGERINWDGPDTYLGKLKQVIDSLTSEQFVLKLRF